MPKISFTTRINMILPLAVTVFMAAVFFLAYFLMHSYLTKAISSQQYQIVSLMADEIDYTIGNMQQRLVALSARITPDRISSPASALDFLHAHEEHALTFDNGLFLFTPQGQMLAEIPLGISRQGMDFSYREYIKETISSRKPYLSAPYVSSQSHHHPAIMFTAPVFDANGALVAILGGSVDLKRTPFIDRLTDIKVGSKGYMFLISKDRVLVSHPDQSRVMKSDTPPGANKLLDRAIAGFDGTDITTTSRGLHALTSFKHLKTKDWIIGANLPLNEAYAPVRTIRLVFLVALFFCALLMFLALRRYLLRITAPLITLTQRVGALSGHNDQPLPDALDYEEVAVIGNSFNNLVTQLNQQKEELAKRELLYRTVVEFSSEMVFWISPDRSSMRYASPSCRDITGYTADEFYANPGLLRSMIHPADSERWLEHCRHAGSCDLSEPLEFRIVAKDGGERWVNHLCRPVFDANNVFMGIRGSFTDITLWKQTDQQLHRQNEYLVALHETTLGLISRHDVAGLLQAIITRAGKLMGTEHCYVYLKNSAGTEMDMVFQSGVFDRFIHHPLRPGEGIAGQVWLTGTAVLVSDYRTWQHRLSDPDRDVLTCMAGVPLKSGDEIVGVLGLAFIEAGAHFNDEQMAFLQQFGELASLALENARLNEESQRELAERKKAETSLRKLSAAVEQSPVSILITNTDGIIEYVNPHMCRQTGYTPEEVIGRNPRIFKSGETSPESYRQLWQTVKAGGEWRGEFLNRKKAGDLYWEHALIAPIRDAQGNITHFIAFKEDITERRRLENQLRHSQKMEAVGQLAGGIAHDFNNILTAIIGYASILDIKIADNNLVKGNIRQIVATAERGASLTQGLLAFSRKQESNPRPIDLNEIIRRVQQLLRRLISEEFHLEIELSGAPLPVMADSVQIEQVLMNLATNARDALEPGGTIIVRSEQVELDHDFIIARGFGRQGRYAMLSFTDSGQGMDDETAKHVFEPFFTTKEVGKGTGLGLSIVYGIIKKHNGYITCNSTTGLGTTFQIYLPLVEADIATSIEEENGSQEMDGIANQDQQVVLLAEDDETTRELTRELLEQFGYTVIEAVDGADALEKFRMHSDQISLLILDAIMPRMKGIDVYHAAQQISPDIRVLFCSGYSEDTIITRGDHDRHQGFLAKPFMPKELLMKIREVLEDGR